MEIVSKRLSISLSVLNTLEDAINLIKEKQADIDRETCKDAMLLRFKHSVYTFLVLLRVYLQEKHLISTTSSKNTLDHAYNKRLISITDYESLSLLLKDYHTACSEDCYEHRDTIAAQIPKHYFVMRNIINHLKA